jgi:hypothetical protein
VAKVLHMATAAAAKADTVVEVKKVRSLTHARASGVGCLGGEPELMLVCRWSSTRRYRRK